MFGPSSQFKEQLGPEISSGCKSGSASDVDSLFAKHPTFDKKLLIALHFFSDFFVFVLSY